MVLLAQLLTRAMPATCCRCQLTRRDVCSHRCIRRLCGRFDRLPTRLVCLGVIVLQSIVLNWYLISSNDSMGYAWILADGLVLAIFVAAFVVSFRQLGTDESDADSAQVSMSGNELPLGFMAWAIYALVLMTRVAVLFKQMDPTKINSGLFGGNMLKTAIALSAVIYLLLIVAHHDSKPHTDRKYYVDHLTTSVTLDILDTVQFLEVLLSTDPTEIEMSTPLRDSIIGIASFNLLLPTVPLIMLSRTRFGHSRYSKLVQTLYTLLYTLIVNVPYIVIRIFLWYHLRRHISVFLTKNIIVMYTCLHDVYETIYDNLNERSLSRNQSTLHTEPDTATSEAIDIIELEDSPHANDVRDHKLKAGSPTESVETEKSGFHVTAL